MHISVRSPWLYLIQLGGMKSITSSPNPQLGEKARAADFWITITANSMNSAPMMEFMNATGRERQLESVISTYSLTPVE